MVFYLIWLRRASCDVIEVKKVGIEDNLGGIVKEDSIDTVSKLVTNTIFRRKIYILKY
jgi:hypothetical protein